MPKIKKIVDIDKNPKKHGKHEHWSDKQKYEAVTLYKLTGNMSAVARTLGIPVDTLYLWKASKWWPQYEADLLQEKRALSTNRITKLSEIAAEITHDRLQNGDWIIVQGQLQRKPVSAVVANRILQDSIKSEIQLEEHYTKEVKAETDLQINERLKLLFDEMTRFANSKEIRSSANKEGGDPLLSDERPE